MVKRGQSQGQAVVEFVLLLFLVMALGLAIKQGLGHSVMRVWKGWTKEIAAPCPKCQPPP